VLEAPADGQKKGMTTAILLNIALALLVFAVIIGIKVWAIVTHHRDRPAHVGERRRSPDRRRRAAPAHVERRSGARRYGEALTA
jgi:hypothetical protein